MKDKKGTQFIPYAIAAAVTVLSMLSWALLFPSYFELNDDLFIQSLLSGAYSGVPEAHAVYMNYPITVFITWLYRLLPMISWYGVLLQSCFGVSLFCILFTAMKKIKNRSNYVFALVPGVLIFWALCLDSYIVIHYTLSAVLLGATALYLFCINSEKETVKDTLLSNTLSIVLLWVVFSMRTQSFLLLLPFAFCIVIWKCFQEKFSGKTVLKNLTVVAVTLLGVALLFGLNKLAYSGNGWSEFTKYNDARTQVYDFTGILPYNENTKTVYDAIGISETEQVLLEEYNTFFTEDVSTEELYQLADATKELNHIDNGFITDMKAMLKAYYTQMRYSQRFHYVSVALLLLYFLCIGIMIVKKDKRNLIFVALLILIRSIVWIYLLKQGRFPERVEYSLYLTEIFTLFAFFYRTMDKKEDKQKWVNCGILTLVSAVVMVLVVGQLLMIRGDLSYKGDNAKDTKVLKEYFAANSDKMFCVDLYSFVFQTEQVHQKCDHSIPENYVVMGGWLTNAPAYTDKMELCGTDSVTNGLIKKGNWYLCIREDRSEESMIAYYHEKGIDIAFVEMDVVEVPSGKRFRILKAEPIERAENVNEVACRK